MAISLKYRDIIPEWAQAELDQLVAGIKGFLIEPSGEHKEDGSHGDITATSVTSESHIQSTDGSVIAAGDVIARNTTTPATMGLLPQLGSVRPGLGMGLAGDPHWRVVVFNPGSSDRELLFQDVAAGGPYTVTLKWRNALSRYVFHGEAASPLDLGLDSPGNRIANVFLSTAGSLFETGRTVALGNWQAYTPTEDSMVNALGNGSLSGRYTIIGRTVHFWARLLVGTTTTFNAAQLRLSLPVAANNAPFAQGLKSDLLDSGTTTHHLGAFFFDATRAVGVTDAGAAITNTVPFAPANNDQYIISGTYEIA